MVRTGRAAPPRPLRHRGRRVEHERALVERGDEPEVAGLLLRERPRHVLGGDRPHLDQDLALGPGVSAMFARLFESASMSMSPACRSSVPSGLNPANTCAPTGRPSRNQSREVPPPCATSRTPSLARSAPRSGRGERGLGEVAGLLEEAHGGPRHLTP